MHFLLPTLATHFTLFCNPHWAIEVQILINPFLKSIFLDPVKSKFKIKGIESGGEIDVGDMRLAPHQVVFQESHNNNDNDNILSL